jgi:hypothetical protein
MAEYQVTAQVDIPVQAAAGWEVVAGLNPTNPLQSTVPLQYQIAVNPTTASLEALRIFGWQVLLVLPTQGNNTQVIMYKPAAITPPLALMVRQTNVIQFKQFTSTGHDLTIMMQNIENQVNVWLATKSPKLRIEHTDLLVSSTNPRPSEYITIAIKTLFYRLQ